MSPDFYWYMWPLLPAFCDVRVWGESKTYYRVTTPPAAGDEPVQLAQARGWLRVGVTGQAHPDDSDIQALISAARKAAENFCDRAIAVTTYIAVSDYFTMPLVGPVSEVVSVKYLDPAGVEQVLANTVYELSPDINKPRLRLKIGQSWPSVYSREDAVRIEHKAGTVPNLTEPSMAHAIKMIFTDMYDHRGNTLAVSGVQPYEMPLGVRFLLNPYRNMGV